MNDRPIALLSCYPCTTSKSQVNCEHGDLEVNGQSVLLIDLFLYLFQSIRLARERLGVLDRYSQTF